jgi:hypothetical protein
MLSLELLKVKADLETELVRWVLDCQRCNRRSTGSLRSGFGRDTGRTRSPAPGDHPPALIG